MGKLIVICEGCARARATITVAFPDGAQIQVCARCEWNGE